MKAFLRELPTPILTYANYDNFMACFGRFPHFKIYLKFK